MHGRYTKVDRQLIGNEDAFQWLLRGDLGGENESQIRAAQEQALQTKYNATKVLQTETENEDCVNSCMRQWNAKISMPSINKITIHKENIIFYVLNCPLNMGNVIGVNSDYKHATTMYHNQ